MTERHEWWWQTHNTQTHTHLSATSACVCHDQILWKSQGIRTRHEKWIEITILTFALIGNKCNKCKRIKIWHHSSCWVSSTRGTLLFVHAKVYLGSRPRCSKTHYHCRHKKCQCAGHIGNSHIGNPHVHHTCTSNALTRTQTSCQHYYW